MSDVGSVALVAELINRHAALPDYRGDFSGRCSCGEPIEGGYPGHRGHVAELVVRALTPEPSELVSIGGPLWFSTATGGLVDLAKAYCLDVAMTPGGEVVMAYFEGGGEVILGVGTLAQSAAEALAILVEALEGR